MLKIGQDIGGTGATFKSMIFRDCLGGRLKNQNSKLNPHPTFHEYQSHIYIYKQSFQFAIHHSPIQNYPSQSRSRYLRGNGTSNKATWMVAVLCSKWGITFTWETSVGDTKDLEKMESLKFGWYVWQPFLRKQNDSVQFSSMCVDVFPQKSTVLDVPHYQKNKPHICSF